MPGGRPRTPTRVLQMRGTHRPDRHGQPEDEPQFEVLTELPPAPGFFSDMARFEWHRVGPELVELQLLNSVSITAFGLYCLNVARAVAAEKVIQEHGMTIKTPQGFEQARPEVAIMRQAGAEVRKFMQEFGMTPSSATRVRVPDKPKGKPDDPWEQVG